MDRRAFLRSSLGALSALALSSIEGDRGRERKGLPFGGSIAGPDEALGHRLLSGRFPKISRERSVPVVIIGGGVSGLSAGWKLNQAGFQDFEVLELEGEAGGVSLSGENSISPYPWGAHYIPLPTEESRAVRELFEDLGVIEGRTPGGRPVFREKDLCFYPQERLYLHGRWQEGLFPSLGATRRDLDQLQAFKKIALAFKRRRGRDGRKAFAIPMELSSRDPDLLALDRVSLAEFLTRRGLDSPRLHWYADYVCRDDYGCRSAETSAWAGLHYFCSRGGGEAEESAVLTWPEGNGWVTKQLGKRLGARIRTRALAYRITERGAGLGVDVYLPGEDASERIHAREVICACPRAFVPYLFPESGDPRPSLLEEFQYGPWMVANLSLKAFPRRGSGMPLSWDNVIYDSPSLGYVVATHQSLATHQARTVLTYYYALAEGPPARERARLLQTPWEEWADLILRDLSGPHPEIRELVSRLDIFRWGHAMVRPRVGFIWGEARRQAALPRGNLYFAHSDLSGFSLFEEAQYRGVLAAERILAKHGVPFSSSL